MRKPTLPVQSNLSEEERRKRLPPPPWVLMDADQSPLPCKPPERVRGFKAKKVQSKGSSR